MIGRTTVTWSDGTQHHGVAELLGSGKACDCFVRGNRGYVLKVQDASWESTSNGVEVKLASSSCAFRACVPAVYGCVRVPYAGYDLSVLVMERAPATHESAVGENLKREATARAQPLSAR